MIESKVEHLVYRVQKRSQTDPALIHDFLDQLTEWKSAIPKEYYEMSAKESLRGGVDLFVRDSICNSGINADR